MDQDYPEILVIVGSGRSGTSYLGVTLASYLDIGIAAEPKFVASTYYQLEKFGDLEKPENLRRLVEHVHRSHIFEQLNSKRNIRTTPDEILERVRRPTYTDVVYAAFDLVAAKRGRSRLGYKDPGDVIHIPLLAKLLPTARFVHIIRDGRDVALSFLKFNWGPTNLYTGCRYWDEAVRRGRTAGAALGDRYFELRLEDLVLDTERVATEMSCFLHRRHDEALARDLIELVNRTKEPGMIHSWKKRMDKKQRYLCEAVAGSTLSACGYEIEFGDRAHISPLQAAYYQGLDLAARVKNRIQGMFGINEREE